jgi:hypothetical protein
LVAVSEFVENRMVDPQKVLQLKPIFEPEAPLVTRIVENLVHLTKISSLTKTQTLSKEQLAEALTVAFWAGLGANEGRFTRVRLLFADLELIGGGDRFRIPLPYTARDIAKLAPAVPATGCLVISPTSMKIVALLPIEPHPSSLNAVSAFLSSPGTVHVSVGPMRPYAVVSNGSATLLFDAVMAFPVELRKRLKKNVEDIEVAHRECCLIGHLVTHIREHGHGGTILIVPDTDGTWTSSAEIAYPFDKPESALRDYVQAQLRDERLRVEAQIIVDSSSLPGEAKGKIHLAIPSYLPEHDRLVARIAPMAFVDGALIITRQLDVVGFGAKIVVSKEIAAEIIIAGPQTGTNRGADLDRGCRRHATPIGRAICRRKPRCSGARDFP